MKDGWRVFDADTHINPAAEVLERYLDPELRTRLPELAPYRIPIKGAVEGPSDFHNYRVGAKLYRRILGEAKPRESFTGQETHWMGTKMPRPGIQDDRAANRVMDMDEEGTDVHFLVPTSWLSLVGLDDPAFEIGLIRAFHRHLEDFCVEFPQRLKSAIVASTRLPEEAVREIRKWGRSRWAAAVLPLLAKDLPADHPSLEPIWREAQEYDLPIAHHSFTWTPPYYPGYLDLWDNIFLGRLAAHPWGAMRFVAAFIGAG
jgi:predicted TIM-barrel fold metal-dependent hydrolase